MPDFRNQTFLNNPTNNWIIALSILLASFIAINIFKKIFLARLKKWASKTETTLDDFLILTIEKSVVPLLYLAAFYFSLKTINTPPNISRIFYVAFLMVATFFVLRIITALVKQFVFSFIKHQSDSETKEKQSKGLLIIVNVTIWILGIVFLIDNLGYDVTTLIAGLGIGGIAIALAAQTILVDLFSYFVIFFDRPFEIGDLIQVEDKMGVVEYVGIKTTRLRTLGGEQLICSNTFLTNQRVHNYKRMLERRVVFKLGVIYQTPHSKLQKIPEIIKSIMEDIDAVRFDRGHFSGFGDFSLDFEFVYYVERSDYAFYMDKQQQIYLRIVAAFEEENIEFAYPTQSLFVEKIPAQKNVPSSSG